MDLWTGLKRNLVLIDSTSPSKCQTTKIQEFTVMNDKEQLTNYNNYKAAKMGEVLSSGSQASARGLAKLAAIMANQGKLDGKSLLNINTWSELHSLPKTCVEANYYFGARTTYTRGGLGLFGFEHMTLPKSKSVYDIDGLTDPCEE